MNRFQVDEEDKEDFSDLHKETKKEPPKKPEVQEEKPPPELINTSLRVTNIHKM